MRILRWLTMTKFADKSYPPLTTPSLDHPYISRLCLNISQLSYGVSFLINIELIHWIYSRCHCRWSNFFKRKVMPTKLRSRWFGWSQKDVYIECNHTCTCHSQHELSRIRMSGATFEAKS
ncbi:hypothetical protein MRB53_006612 [Persea americana]|uniref:Uncharacterized protein n=1 Tax=Persea americana TaxID=3435 RepID=A0ACC2MHQ2_PERAE|nr:hypothetical protein MRB53_006612 [Persea americana]